MNFIKRGWLGITRKKGKSLILLLVIFIMGNLISGAVSIQQASENAESTIKTRLGGTATIDMDYEALDEAGEEAWMEIQNVGIDLINQIGALSYVKYYDFNTTAYLGSDSIEGYTGEMEDEYEVEYWGPITDLYLKGINYAPVLDFEEEKGKLIDGRILTEEEIENGSAVSIISEKLAAKNNISVGDTIQLKNDFYDYMSESMEPEVIAERDLVLEVVGIFQSTTINRDNEQDEMDGGYYDYQDIDYQNTIYVPNQIVISENRFQIEEYKKIDPDYAEMYGEEETDYYYPLFIMNQPEDLESFTEEVTPLLPKYNKVVSSADSYASIAAPIESMSKLSGYILWAAIGSTILIISLVVLLFLRDRKHELGIYLSLGERRSRVVGQILFEVFVIGFIAISISLFTGNLLASGVSATFLDAESGDEMYDDGYYYYGDIATDLTTSDALEAYQVELSGSYVAIFYGIGLLTILLSTLVPLIYLVRLNPKKILM